VNWARRKDEEKKKNVVTKTARMKRMAEGSEESTLEVKL
jgi:hypothetical protein